MGLSGVCGNLFDSQLTPFPTPRPTPHPTTSTPTPSPTWISSFDTWTGGPVTFSVWIQEVNAGFPEKPTEHDCGPAPFGGTGTSCLPDIWCRILLPDGEQVRTDSVSNDDTPKWDQSEALTVTLDQNDYIDVKCWDADGDGDQESLGWKHIPTTDFFPCGMQTQEYSLCASNYDNEDGCYTHYDNKVSVSVTSENPDVQDWCAAKL